MDEEARAAVPGARPGYGGATACHMPEPADPKEAEVYTNFRRLIVRAHCADSRPHHKCAGVITIARDTITLNCPRCGDLRKIINQEPDYGEATDA